MKKIKFRKGSSLFSKAKKIIPGGTMLLSKSPNLFLPNGWPNYFTKTKGCEVWDLDGNKFHDFSLMGVGTNILGYSNSKVDSAVKKVVSQGNMSTLNCKEEVELLIIKLSLASMAKLLELEVKLTLLLLE